MHTGIHYLIFFDGDSSAFHFVIFTNMSLLLSKGRHLRYLSNVQVRVEGFVLKVSDEESEQYFHSRSREIQIAPALGEQVLALLFNPEFSLVLDQHKIFN